MRPALTDHGLSESKSRPSRGLRGIATTAGASGLVSERVCILNLDSQFVPDLVIEPAELGIFMNLKDVAWTRYVDPIATHDAPGACAHQQHAVRETDRLGEVMRDEDD